MTWEFKTQVQADGSMVLTSTSSLLASYVQGMAPGKTLGTFYFDSGANKFRVSENTGNTYTDLVPWHRDTTTGALYPSSLADQVFMGRSDITSAIFLISTNTTATPALYVSSTTGWIGVGTTSPQALLDINGGVIFRSLSTWAGPATTPGVSASNQGTIYYDATQQAFMVSENGGDYTPMLSATSPSPDFTGSLTVQGTMTVQGSAFSVGGSTLVVSMGSVGIRTTAPAAALDVASAGSGNSQIWRDGSSVAKATMSASGVLYANYADVSDPWGYRQLGQPILTSTGLNVMVGIGAGANNTDPNNGSVYLGYNAGNATTGNGDNVFIGYEAGKFATSFNNVFIGADAGYNAVGGGENVFIGEQTGQNAIDSAENTFVGMFAGPGNTTGDNNTFLGGYSGHGNTSGNNNVSVGYYAYAGQGSSNTVLGSWPGVTQNIGAYASITHDGDVFIGYNAGLNETRSNVLAIANSETSAPLIFGDFSSGRVGISTGMPGAALDVNPGASETYDQVWRNTSGTIVASMSVTGVLYANGSGLTGISASDNTKVAKTGDTMTGSLNISGSASTLTVQGNAFSVGTSTFVVTAGSVGIASATPTGLLTVGGGNAPPLVVNGGNVGFGTKSPAYPIDVVGAVNVTNANGYYESGSRILVSSANTQSTLVGVNAGAAFKGANSANETFVGYAAGNATTSGTENTFIGYSAGAANTTGSGSVLVGAYSGYNNTGQGNVALGWSTFYGTGAGSYNAAVGYYAGHSIAGDGTTTGLYNTLLGYYAGESVSSGNQNTIVGASAGDSTSDAINNVSIGYTADYYNRHGSSNTILGALAGYGANGASHTGNVFIGYQAGYFEDGNNKLYIANSLTSNPLIYGDFSSGRVGISTGGPAGALDIMPGASETYDQIWRNTSGTIVASMSVSGVLYANGSGLTGISASDNTKVAKTGDTMTGSLNISGSASTLTVQGNAFSVGGSTLVALAGKVGIGSASPGFALDVVGPVNVTNAMGYYQSGSSILTSSSSSNNTFVGLNAGNAGVSGTNNLFAGVGAGQVTTTGGSNTFLGYQAGVTNAGGSSNAFVGYWAGHDNLGGLGNAFLGYYAGKDNAAGSNNTAVGYAAGFGNQNGIENVFIGYDSGPNNAGSGNKNIVIGSNANYNNFGSSSTVVGAYAGLNGSSGYNGSGNVLLGYQAGFYEGGNNKLYIANSSTNTLLYGDFAGMRLGISTQNPQGVLDVGGTGNVVFENNGNVGIGSANPAWALDVSSAINTNYPFGYLQNGLTVLVSSASTGNTLVGYLAGNLKGSGGGNTFVGQGAGTSNTSGANNVAIGGVANYNNQTGIENVAIGYQAGLQNTASDNTFVGMRAGYFNSSGAHNTLLGHDAGSNSTTGANNVYVGEAAGFGAGAASASNNVALGYQAGASNNTGNYNVFLGNQAGFNETGSNKLYIANTGTVSPLIYGDFGLGNVGISTGVASSTLTVAGSLELEAIAAPPVANANTGRIYFDSTQQAFMVSENGVGYTPMLTATAPSPDFTGSLTVQGTMTVQGNAFSVGGSTLVALAGNVGIGTAAPAYLLDVNGNANALKFYENGHAVLLTAGESLSLGVGANPVTSGSYNTYLGAQAGPLDTGQLNTYIGDEAALQMTGGQQNVFVGADAGGAMASGSYNTYVGMDAGNSADGGYYNTGVGNSAGMNYLGNNNVSLGIDADNTNWYGSSSVVLGAEAGPASGPGSHNYGGNVLIGYGAGSTLKPSNILIIDNSMRSAPLLYGNFAAGRLGISTMTSAAALDVVPSGSDAAQIWRNTSGVAQATMSASGALSAAYTDVSDAFGYRQNGVSILLSSASTNNTFVGVNAGNATLSGTQNVFVGVNAGNSITTAGKNTFVGYVAGQYDTTGDENTFLGFFAGNHNDTGADNTILGYAAGENNTSGYDNVIIGSGAGDQNNTGAENTYVGFNAGTRNTSGGQNSFFGGSAGGQNTTGQFNTALGYRAGNNNQIGSSNTVVGWNAAFGFPSPASNSGNSILGYQSGFKLTSGSTNTLVGASAGYNITTGGGNVILGANAGTGLGSGNNNIIIGANQDAAFSANNFLNIGGVLYGDLSSGYVGIGTTGPGYPLEVNGVTMFRSASNWAGLGSSPGVSASNQGTIYYDSGQQAFMVSENGGDYTPMLSATSPSPDFTGSLTVQGTMTVQGNAFSVGGSTLVALAGSVGIGTASPQFALHVSSTIDTDFPFGYYQNGISVLVSSNSTGNTFVGALAGSANTTGGVNTFLGGYAGNANTSGSYNTFLGDQAGLGNTTGSYNSIIGMQAGQNLSTGNNNVFLGYWAGQANNSSGNVMIGHTSGASSHGGSNVFVGDGAGSTGSGSSNVMLGVGAGGGTGSSNIFIGASAGQSEAGSSKLYIANSSTNTLLYGDFAAMRLGISTQNPQGVLDVGGTGNVILEMSGNVGIGTTAPAAKLHVAGDLQVGNAPSASTLSASGFFTLAQISQPANATGRIYYDSSANKLRLSTGNTAGSWVDITTGTAVNSVSGSGTPNYLAKFTAASTVGNSLIYDNGTNVGIGKASPSFALDVASIVNVGNDWGYYQNGYSVLTSSTSDTFVGLGAGSLSNVNNDQGLTFVGVNAGALNTTGWGNVFVGDYSGAINDAGVVNTFIGEEAGSQNTAGSDNTYVGRRAGGSTTGNNNTAMGVGAGANMHDASSNAFFGESAGSSVTGSSNTMIGAEAGSPFGTPAIAGNTFIGYQAGQLVNNGNNSVMIGLQAGANNSSAADDVTIGALAGYNAGGINSVSIGSGAGYQAGSYNVILGYQAGYSNTSSNNIFLGYQAGYNEAGGNKLYIANSSTPSPLIYGDFLKGNVGISTGVANSTLTVAGSLELEAIAAPPVANANTGRIYYDSTQQAFMVSENGVGYTPMLTATSASPDFTGSLTVGGTMTVQGNAFSVGGSTLVALAGKVGIGSASPGYALDVVGAVNVTSPNGYYQSGSQILVSSASTHSTFVGNGAGTNFGGASLYATVVGNNAGYSLTGGVNNTFIGNTAGYNNVSGTDNTFLGFNAGQYVQGSFNTALGSWSGGAQTGFNTSGAYNTSVGYAAGDGLAGNGTTTGVYNVFLGYEAGAGLPSLNFTGSSNTFVGAYSGVTATGVANVFIGYQAGYSEKGNNKLYIANTKTASPLIYGDFSTGRLGISTGVPAGTLDIAPAAPETYGQIWRSTSGVIVASMSVSGLLYADGSALRNLTSASTPASISVSTIAATATTPFNGVNVTTSLFVSGNLGVGTTNPAYKLDIAGDVNTTGFYRLSGSTVLATTSGGTSLNVGPDAGPSNTAAEGVFVGVSAGHSLSASAAGASTFVGYQAGYSYIGGAGPLSDNTFIGHQAGHDATSGHDNTFLGNVAGYKNTTGEENAFLGAESGQNNTTGGWNTFVGYQVGNINASGWDNTFLGADAGNANTSGYNNVYLGMQAAYTGNGSSNTIVGMDAGHYTHGDGNVMLGYQAGMNETGGSKLYIANSGTASPLIYGDFSAGRLGISTGAPQAALDVEGTSTNLFIVGTSTLVATLSGSVGIASATPTGLLTVGGGNAPGLVVLANGNVGFGTKGPLYQVDSVGNINTWNNNGYYQFGQRILVSSSTTATTLVGQNAGLNFDNGASRYDTFVGVSAGQGTTSGVSDTFIGASAGQSNGTASANTFVGSVAGYANSSGNSNTAIGSGAAQWNDVGGDNVFIGANAAFDLNGSSNVAIGSGVNTYGTLHTNNGNVFIGYDAAHFNRGNDNTLIGMQAGKLAFGSSVTALGTFAGYNSGDGGVFIGYSAGQNETGANKLYIANSNTPAPLIYGDFSLGNVGISTGVAGSTLTVPGAVELDQIGAPAPSAANTGRIYFDSTSHSFQVSENGGAYVSLLGSGPGLASTQTFSGQNTFTDQVTISSSLVVNSFINTNYPNGYYENNSRLIVSSANTGVTFIGVNAGLAYTGKTLMNDVFVGVEAGSATTTGTTNVFVGFQAGARNTTTSNNTYVGYQAGFSSSNGADTAIGYAAGFSNTGTHDTFLGYEAGQNQTANDYDTYLGDEAGQSSSNGSHSVLIGYKAGFSGGGTGGNNVIVGDQAAVNATSGGNNVLIGQNARGGSADDGSSNVMVGYQAGYSATGSGNIFLGPNAGYNEAGSNKLYIANTSTAALIYGDFALGNVGISTGVANSTLTVNGSLELEAVAAPPVANSNTGRIYYDSTQQAFMVSENGVTYTPMLTETFAAPDFTSNLTVNSTLTVQGSGFSVGGSTLVARGGYVGIGTGTPNSPLTIQTTTAPAYAILVSTTGSAGTTTIFSLSTAGVLFAQGGVTYGGDVAELYPVSGTAEPGDILMLDAAPSLDGLPRVRRGLAGRGEILGVYASRPGVTLGAGDIAARLEGKAPVALSGRVPIKVSLENGPIMPGDFLTASTTRPGYAAKAVASGRVVGLALEAYSGREPGTILCFVNVHYWASPREWEELRDELRRLKHKLGEE